MAFDEVEAQPTGPEKATFALGAFWAAEAVFRHFDGVIDTRVGYVGGHTENPTFEEVATNITGHAEAVEVTFDPVELPYERLLARFWQAHDPTATDRLDPATPAARHRYRSAIFTHSTEQDALARASLDEERRYTSHRIHTEIRPISPFWPAENRHQQYLEKAGVYALIPDTPGIAVDRPYQGPRLREQERHLSEPNELRTEFGDAFRLYCTAGALRMALAQDPEHFTAAVSSLRRWRANQCSVEGEDWSIDSLEIYANVSSATAGLTVSARDTEHLFLANLAPGHFHSWPLRGDSIGGRSTVNRGQDGAVSISHGYPPSSSYPPRHLARSWPDEMNPWGLGPRGESDPHGGPPGTWHEHITETGIELGCGGDTKHSLQWRQGQFQLGVDGELDPERTLAALGGKRCRCIAIFDALRRIPTRTDDFAIMSCSVVMGSGQGLPRHQPTTPTHDGFEDGIDRTLAEVGQGSSSKSPFAQRHDIVACSMPWALRSRWLLTHLVAWEQRRPELDRSELAMLRSCALAPLVRTAIDTIWQWCRHDPTIGYADMEFRLLESGGTPWAEGLIDRDTARISLGVPLRWLTHVWTRDMTSIDGHLILSVDGASEAHDLDVTAVAWDESGVGDGGQPPALLTRKMTAEWDGVEWHLVGARDDAVSPPNG